MSQQTKTFIATIGPAATPDGTMTPAEFDSTLYQKYLSQGYTWQDSHFIENARGQDNRIEGVKILVVLTREYEEVKVEKPKIEKDHVKTEEVVTPA